MSSAGLIVTQTATGTRSTSGGKLYPASATDPVSPTPADGDLYYNTALAEWMFYDATRVKWLSIATFTVQAGRSGNTNAGTFYRGVDGLLLDAANKGIPVYTGTLVSIAIARTDADAATLDTLVNGAVIDSLAHAAAGATRDDAVNADFSAGLMSFQNQAGGNQTTDVQIIAVYRRRV